MFDGYNGIMNTKSIPLQGKHSGVSGSVLVSLLRRVYWVMHLLLSAIVALLTSLWFVWVNQKQDEFDMWESKIKDRQ